MSAPKPQGFATASIHAGYDPDSLYGAINTPIYASTTFAQNGLNELRGGYEYTRCGNPTIAALEKIIAQWRYMCQRLNYYVHSIMSSNVIKAQETR